MSRPAVHPVRSSAPEALARSIVQYEHGARKRVGEFWSDRGSFLVFLRHFACPGCSEQLALVSPYLAELRREGTRVVLVATSAPNRIPAFAKRMHLDYDSSGGASPGAGLVEVVTDPSLATHKAANLVRSLGSLVNVRTIAEAVRLYAQGHFSTHEPGDGDVFQQGGALLVDRDGTVLFQHANRDMTDHFSMDDVCDALGRRSRPSVEAAARP